MKALVTGSRNFFDYEWIASRLAKYPLTEIITGGAIGVDANAERYAREKGLKSTILKPDWDKYGKAAGYKRNSEMLKLYPTIIIAFWDGESSGTKDMIDKGNRVGIPVSIHNFKEEAERKKIVVWESPIGDVKRIGNCFVWRGDFYPVENKKALWEKIKTQMIAFNSKRKTTVRRWNV